MLMEEVFGFDDDDVKVGNDDDLQDDDCGDVIEVEKKSPKRFPESL